MAKTFLEGQSPFNANPLTPEEAYMREQEQRQQQVQQTAPVDPRQLQMQQQVQQAAQPQMQGPQQPQMPMMQQQPQLPPEQMGPPVDLMADSPEREDLPTGLDPKRALWAGLLMDIGNYVGSAGQRPMQGLGPKMMRQTAMFNQQGKDKRDAIQAAQDAREDASNRAQDQYNERMKISADRRAVDVEWREAQAASMQVYRDEGRSEAALIRKEKADAAKIDAAETDELIDEVAEGVLNYTMKMPSTRSKRGLKVSGRVHEIARERGITFTQGKYDQIIKNEDNFATGPAGIKVRALNTIIQHADAMLQIGTDLGNTNNQIVNRARNAYKAATGDTAPTDFDALKIVLGDEIASYFTPGVGSQAEREAIQNSISSAMTYDQLASALDVYKHAMKGQLSSLNTQYQLRAREGASLYQRHIAPETLIALGLDSEGNPVGDYGATPDSGFNEEEGGYVDEDGDIIWDK